MPLDWSPALEQLKRSSLVGAEAAAQIILESSNDLVPVKSGDLRDSGKVTSAILAGGAVAVVSYGDSFPSQAYAVKEHEDLEAHHDDGSAKFLERGFAQSRKRALAAIAGSMRSIVGPGLAVRGRRAR
jgi:hypothetical protein